MFSYASSSSISYAMVTPSLVIRGDPNFFSRTTLRPLGPSVTFTASASASTPRSIARRASSPKRISFAILYTSLTFYVVDLLLDDRQDVAFAQNQHFFVVHFDFRTSILRENHAISDFDLEILTLPIFELARADSDNLALLRFLLRIVRKENATCGFLFTFNWTHHNAISERLQHVNNLPVGFECLLLLALSFSEC